MPQKPNLLFVFTDEQAAATMAAYGNHRIHTPNTDRLARRSVVFQNAYVTQPVCTPSRASLMTGLYPHTSGCTENNVPLGEQTPCLPELADFHDYKTAYHGKWHLGDEIFAQHGFDEWISIEDGYRGHYRPSRDRQQHSTYYQWLLANGFKPDSKAKDGFEHFSRAFCCRLPEEFSKPAYLAREAGRFIRQNRDNAWLLMVNFLEPHMPFFSCRDGQYDPADVTLPPNFEHELTEANPLKTRAFRRAYAERGHSGLPLRTEADWRRMIANYWGLCSLVDTHLGTILSAVEQCGLADETIIVYTSDHGDMMGSHGLIAKCVMFQEAVRVPLLVRIPGVECGGRAVRAPVSQVDIVPTLLEAMGRQIPRHLEGYSWMPLLRGDGILTEKDVFIEWNSVNSGFGDTLGKVNVPGCVTDTGSAEQLRAAVTDPVRTVISQDLWKYNRGTLGEDELYDLRNDPHETTNLARQREHAGRIRDLQARIDRWQQRTGDTVGWPE